MNISRSQFLKQLGLSVAALSVGGNLVKALGQMTAPSTNAATGAAGEMKPIAVNSGPGFGNRLAITFDDGPSPGITERVLVELKKRDLRASFFMIGSKVKASPDLAKRVYDEGHELCNHSFTHPKLDSLSDDRVRDEILRCQEAISNATGYTPVWLRPPYGAFRGKAHIAQDLGLGIAYWSVDPRDWMRPGAQRITDSIVAQARPGSIILCHDLHTQTADAVPNILDRLLDRDYEFTSMSGFLGQPYTA